MLKKRHIDVRDRIDGPVVRGIVVKTFNNSPYSLASRLMYKGEKYLTVMVDSLGRFGQILTGRHKGGLYCCKGKTPKYLLTPQEEKIDTHGRCPKIL